VCSAAITQLFQSLGRAGALLATPLLQSLGQLCAGAAEAEDAGAAAAPIAAAAQAALGAAIRSLGPEAVLAALPLQLQEVCTAAVLQHTSVRRRGPAQ
jgi:ribosomal RNA-processing protein 12